MASKSGWFHAGYRMQLNNTCIMATCVTSVYMCKIALLLISVCLHGIMTV